MSLNDYFHRHIFEPLGVENVTMMPSLQMKKDLVHMNQRAADGTLSYRDQLLRQSLISHDGKATFFNSGGAGCFAKPQEYCKILAMLLNDGVGSNGTRVLKASTIEEMFKNQIPHMPNFARNPIASAKPDLSNPMPELYPQPPEQEQGWGLTFFLTPHPGPTGRGPNTAHWAGLPNLWWWCDRSKGVAGFVCTQILPSGDLKTALLTGEVEAGVYQGLQGPKHNL